MLHYVEKIPVLDFIRITVTGFRVDVEAFGVLIIHLNISVLERRSKPGTEKFEQSSEKRIMKK